MPQGGRSAVGVIRLRRLDEASVASPKKWSGKDAGDRCRVGLGNPSASGWRLCFRARMRTMGWIRRESAICARAENLLDEMALLFRGRAGQQIKGWPEYGPEFPHHILTRPLLDVALSAGRIKDIASAFSNDSPITIGYIAPWNYQSIEPGSADLVLSHVVMQYIGDLVTVYTTMYDWLKPGGVISHQIDFSGLQFAQKEWNRHWSRGEWTWRMIVGNRPGAISRLPFSAHVSAMGSAGFEIVCAMIETDQGGILREALASRWAGLSDTDLHARGGFIQARKPSG